MSKEKVLLGLLAGVTAGALLGVLFAPEKGSVTRKNLEKTVDEYADVMTGKFNEFIDTISEKIQEVKEEVENIKVNQQKKS
jgi:gas vesicle protein